MKTTKERIKASIERDVFLTFATRLGERKLWTSVESQDPPQPDLLCTHKSLGTIAFELVAITDPAIAKINADSKKHFGTAFWTSDPTERIIRKKLNKKYKSAYPIELLIYNDFLIVTPDEGIVEIASNWLGSMDHLFRKAWFMGENELRLIWQNDA